MGSTIDTLAEKDTNCIVKKHNTCQREFIQYDQEGNEVYYYRYQNNLFNRFVIQVYDTYNNEVGQIEKVNGCCEINFTFYDESRQIIYYIVKHQNCCENTFTFYNSDNNKESMIKIKHACCERTFEEFDKYESRINSAIGKPICSGFTYYENDIYGSPKFIIKIMNECKRQFLKIYDSNNMEVNLNNKSIFKDGFTRIQIVIIINLLFEEGNNNNNNH